MCVSWICVLFWFVCVCVFADYMCFWGRGCLQDSERNTDRHGNFLSVLRMPPLGYGRIRKSAVRAVKLQRAHDLAAVKRAVPTIFNKAHAHTAFLPWSRVYCRCATSLRDVLPMVTRRCSMRVKRGPRAHAVAQGGAPAIDGRVLSTTKGVKLQRAPNMAAEKCCPGPPAGDHGSGTDKEGTPIGESHRARLVNEICAGYHLVRSVIFLNSKRLSVDFGVPDWCRKRDKRSTDSCYSRQGKP